MAISASARGETVSKKKEITPEIFFARKLASNDKKIRDKFLRKLRKWISSRSSVPDAFNDEELRKLWKGLFFCMWMSDKPLIQEDLAETISSLVRSIEHRKTGLTFVKFALLTMAKNWAGIDTWRMDKFMMLVRRIIRHSLEYLAEKNWDAEEVEMYSNMLSDSIMNANKTASSFEVPVGLQLHITNLFPEELAKAGAESLPSSAIVKMLEPFAKCLSICNDQRLKKEITQHIFIYLMKQSDEGLEHEDEEIAKYSKPRNVEKLMSVKNRKNETEAEGSQVQEKVDENEEDSLGEEDADDVMENLGEVEASDFDWGAKDPRAGGVDVVLSQLKPNYEEMATMLMKHASEKNVRTKNRQPMHRLVKRFRDLNKGVYPLKVVLPEVGPGLTPNYMRHASRRYIKEELKRSESKELQKLEYKKLKKSSLKNVLDEDEEEEDVDEEGEEESEEDPEDEEIDLEDEEDLDEEEEEDLDDEDDDLMEEEDVEEIVLPVKAEKVKPSKVTKAKKIQPVKASKLSHKPTVVTKPIKKSLTVSTGGIQYSNGFAISTIAKSEPKPSTSSTSSSAKFEVNDDWSETPTSESSKPQPESSLQELKKQLKAQKRATPWNENLSAGEVEIVIPNKKYKGPVALKAAPPAEESDSDSGPGFAGKKNRRVSIILRNNKAQEHKDYQESLKKSPGIPHDPDRQPSGGLLKPSKSQSGDIPIESYVAIGQAIKKTFPKKNMSKFIINVNKRRPRHANYSARCSRLFS